MHFDKQIAFTFIKDIRKDHIRTTSYMVLQIVTIKKTETGYLCQFSDNTGTIQGTLNK